MRNKRISDLNSDFVAISNRDRILSLMPKLRVAKLLVPMLIAISIQLLHVKSIDAAPIEIAVEEAPRKEVVPVVKREMRAVWVATIFNIDWPSKRGLSSESMKLEMMQLLDKFQRLNFNTVILQVRADAETLYPSPYEPWSRFLTGSTGVGPDSNFDPLRFAVEECHRRGMELHAWINPYRVSRTSPAVLLDSHPFNAKKDWLFDYGDNTYLEPGNPEVRKWVVDVVSDVVRRYDIDGIHMDDYFYPYPKAGLKIDDDAMLRKYSRGFNLSQKSAWRRDNVDIIISDLSRSIKSIKPWVKFGISPFGVWRNNRDDVRGSAVGATITNYDDLYADVLKWTDLGWIDYVSPQIYWNIGYNIADFNILTRWWAKNVPSRDVYIGHALYKVDGSSSSLSWSNGNEIPNQIRLLRSVDGIKGSVYYSANHIDRDLLGLKSVLQNDLYRYPSLTPKMPWIDNTPPAAPSNVMGITEKSGKTLTWNGVDGAPLDRAVKYCVYRFTSKPRLKEALKRTEHNFNDLFYIGTSTQFTMTKEYMKSRGESLRKKCYYLVTAVDRLSNESWYAGYVKF